MVDLLWLSGHLEGNIHIPPNSTPCTCAMEALPNGFSSKTSKTWRIPTPETRRFYINGQIELVHPPIHNKYLVHLVSETTFFTNSDAWLVLNPHHRMEHPWPRREPNLKCADRNLWCGSKRSLPLMVPEQNQLRKQSPHFRRESFLQRKPISCTSWKAIETHLCFNGFFGVEVWTNTFFCSAFIISSLSSQGICFLKMIGLKSCFSWFAS